MLLLHTAIDEHPDVSSGKKGFLRGAKSAGVLQHTACLLSRRKAGLGEMKQKKSSRVVAATAKRERDVKNKR